MPSASSPSSSMAASAAACAAERPRGSLSNSRMTARALAGAHDTRLRLFRGRAIGCEEARGEGWADTMRFASARAAASAEVAGSVLASGPLGLDPSSPERCWPASGGAMEMDMAIPRPALREAPPTAARCGARSTSAPPSRGRLRFEASPAEPAPSDSLVAPMSLSGSISMAPGIAADWPTGTAPAGAPASSRGGDATEAFQPSINDCAAATRTSPSDTDARFTLFAVLPIPDTRRAAAM
mmetsp:Transcript_1466/g.4162  ORF Transcript_1466/g.4162 Transcript_1466/m.4162 type:complete len:240 (-) Transcript_1466:2009-2728(-)